MTIIYRGLKKCFDKLGQFIPDPTPVAIPAGFEKPESLEQRIARIVRSNEMTRLAENSGSDTFDEYDDFEDTEDNLPWSKHELMDIEPNPSIPPLEENPPQADKRSDAPAPSETVKVAKPKTKIRRTITEEEIDE